MSKEEKQQQQVIEPNAHYEVVFEPENDFKKNIANNIRLNANII